MCCIYIHFTYSLITHLLCISSFFTAESPLDFYFGVALFSTLLWFTGIFMLRYTLQGLLMYNGWMYEPRNTMSLATKIWLVNINLIPCLMMTR